MKKNWPMRIASILLCLVVFTTCLVSGLYARYTTKGSSYDSARVIKFGNLTLEETGNFKTVGDKNKFMIIPGVNIEKDIHVSFTGSESATYVFIEMDITSPWTTTDNTVFKIKNETKEFLTWTMENDWTFLKKDGTTYVYYLTLDPNEILDKDVIANNGAITINETITNAEMNTITVSSINVNADIVQVGDFKNATEAYTSLVTNH